MQKTFLSAVLGFVCVASGCVNQPSKTASAPQSSLQERIAKELAEASPMADAADAHARDLASKRLANCESFRSAVGERVLWGGCDPVKGFDPRTYTLTEFEPLVWLKLYASTIMFTGEHEIRQEGPYSVLEMKAKFRSNLDVGDYPYPFWHSPKKWQAYLDLVSLVVVFERDKIIATYRLANSDPAKAAAERPWDGKWHWIDARGQEQPRVALFSYMFGDDNPYREGVDHAYRQLEAKVRAQNCTACHAPDNKGKARALLMLNFPNQSLIARHKLVHVLESNEMPPEDINKHQSAGIADITARKDLVQLAKAFVKEADAAIAYESSRKSSSYR